MVFIYVVSKRKILIAVGIVILALAAILAIVSETAASVGRCVIAAVTSGTSGRLVPVYKVAREDKAVAITVDATWGDDKTLALLDLFDRHRVHVTFFVAGNWIQSFPDKVKAIAERGHEVGNHSWTHPHMSALPPEKIREEVERTQKAIALLTGVRPKLFRPPFGDYSNPVIALAEECGCRTIQWSVDSLDWKDIGAAQIRHRVMSKVHPGAVVLFHNAGKHTVEALELILGDLKAGGYTVIPVSELLLAGETYVDRNTGEQRPVRSGAPPVPGAPERDSTPVPAPAPSKPGTLPPRRSGLPRATEGGMGSWCS
ncbi:MAG: polysaccharide deacetylase family protein [Clostridia bacterium]|nr:polysaccharide deacetylase family protein [Clostridia bacterium]